MNRSTETTCKNWYMHKKGKVWVYGCSLFIAGVVLTGPAGMARADDLQSVSQDTPASSVQASSPSQLASETAPSETAATGSSTELASPLASQAQEQIPDAQAPDSVNSSSQEATSQQATKATPASQETGTESETTGYQTNLTDLSYDSSVWQVRSDGLYSNALGKGDNFLYSQSQGKNFVYQTDVTFLTNEGAASLVFRTNNDKDDLKGYVVNLDAASHKAKLWRWNEANLIDEKSISPVKNNTYHLKVIATDQWLSYYVNDQLVANLSDYTLQKDDRGQTTYIPEGYFGLLNWNGEMLFQNTRFTLLDDQDLPFIQDVTVTSTTGSVEKAGQFFPKEAVHIQYVANSAKTIDLSVVTQNPKATVTVEDAKGNSYPDLKAIPLEVGANYLTLTSTVVSSSGEVVPLTYRINVHRRQPAEVYYNELYRDQYHYSVKDGWANDPNGLVYYKGTYHMFYQFYDDTQWGPMHWAHATSKDLLHWEDQPIAFYPDANGMMFSGSIVVDDHNTSGLFKDGEGGLVALITVDGEGQRIKIAYSSDEGKTWQKSDQIVADWANDPLQSRDFRDPKVFRWENKWFMVLAGGPLRIYSSDNLRDWKVESTYPDLNTECPDLYPITTDDGQLKWVLSRGGRFYKVGDFKPVNGAWTYLPDAAYQNQDGIMNFGKDSYAAMTYYVQDFGTSDHPTIPQLIEVNWMNTWDDYCRLVADTVDQDFNGTFNLNLNLGLTKDGDNYVLTQRPIAAYQSLRDTAKAITYKDVTVSADNDLFKDFKSDTYEIVATFRPDQKTTKVGFNLRVGHGQVTKVIYDFDRQELSLDRSQSGTIITDVFAKVNSQKVTKNADGSIDLHLFVDRASVEVFAKGYTAAGANQIFPAPDSLGLSVFSEGAAAKADIAVYPLASIWTEKQTVNHALAVVAANAKPSRLNVGGQLSLTGYIMPANAPQAVTWSVSDPSVIAVESDGSKAVAKALKKGQATVRVAAKENPNLYKEFPITVFEDRFNTNVAGLKATAGNWYVDGESLLDSNQATNDAYMSTQALAFGQYKMGLDVAYTKGVVNLFFASQSSDPANAYAIQFNDTDSIRLYRFYGDTIKEAQMPFAINDGRFHHIDLVKTANGIQVKVDQEPVLDYTFDQVDDYYNSPYVGLGLWDGAVAFQNFLVADLNQPADQASQTANAPLVEGDKAPSQAPVAQAVAQSVAQPAISLAGHVSPKQPATPVAPEDPAALPDTGDASSPVFGLSLGALIASLGAALSVRKKKSHK